VIGLAHGSRHTEGGAAIERLMAAVAEAGGMQAAYAYLDLAEPRLHAAAAAVAATGHRRAVVVPLLFTVAFHATVDVPQSVAAASEAAGIELTLADILGTGDDIAELLTAALADARVAHDSSVLLYAVGSSTPAANAAVTDLAARLEGARHRPVRAAFATCDPRPAEVVGQFRGAVVVLPLFLSDGLLLDPIRTLAAEQGWTMVEPLGERAAAVVLDRYLAALHEPTDMSGERW
jgi:sirohydrochlorin cobaltochelatase